MKPRGDRIEVLLDIKGYINAGGWPDENTKEKDKVLEAIGLEG